MRVQEGHGIRDKRFGARGGKEQERERSPTEEGDVATRKEGLPSVQAGVHLGGAEQEERGGTGGEEARGEVREAVLEGAQTCKNSGRRQEEKGREPRHQIRHRHVRESPTEGSKARL